MIIIFILFFLLHSLFWFGSNYQFAENVDEKTALYICLLLSVPTSIATFYATKYAYSYLETAWSVRLFGFGVGYIVFPILTWFFLHESPFTTKTILSIILAFTIIGVQLFVPNN